MRNHTGKPVRHEDFFDRDRELEELCHLVERDNVLLLAPRRVGKTSLLLRLLDEPKPGWRCSFLDVEAVDSEARFVARLLACVHQLQPESSRWSRLGERARELLGKIKISAGPLEVELAEAISRDWQEIGNEALRSLGDLPEQVLLLLDEFPIFVRRLLSLDRGAERTRLLLDWFRAARIDPAFSESGAHLLLAGSVGLDAVTAQVGLSGTINDLVTYRLGPLSGEEARELLARLAEGEGMPLSPEIVERILGHIDWPIPYHLQLIFDQLLRRVRFRGASLDERLVDTAYRELLSSDNRKHFSHWEERLRDPLIASDERSLMRRLLEAAARDLRGIDEAVILQVRRQHAPEVDEKPVLLSLEHDGYLVKNGDRWRFASSLLRDWWLQWHVSGGRP